MLLADNQLAITGSGWDPELLRLELGELKLGGFDLSLTGFGDLELKDLSRTPPWPAPPRSAGSAGAASSPPHRIGVLGFGTRRTGARRELRAL